ncbi:hypothetical protein [Mesorhizobium sp. 1M-11]|uniref:hypothetical protein n=1 Tax=Mesorhizobium sp. 1M-11 TaxID=1529006 RepID=UPI0006C750C1|nr:hypothetical protein [Mesorhizobium sp. 1M-11]
MIEANATIDVNVKVKMMTNDEFTALGHPYWFEDQQSSHQLASGRSQAKAIEMTCSRAVISA